MNKKAARIKQVDYSDFLRRNKAIVIAVLVFALLGVLLMLRSSAATSIALSEAENGTPAGSAVKVADATASGGSAVKFGSGGVVSPPGPGDPPQPTGPAYYVDCQAGNDAAAGTSPQTAFRSLGKASAITLRAGENLLLKSGCRWSGESLDITESGTASARITVGKYGGDAKPILESNREGMNIVKVSGSYVTIQSLNPKAIAPRTVTVSNCRLPNDVKTANVGHVVGIQLAGSNNIAQYNETFGGYSGIQISGGNGNKVLYNTVRNADMMDRLDSGGDNDAGAFAVHVYNSNNSEIAYNFITGALACSFDYVADGGAIEFFNGGSGLIHHNKVENSDAFTEVGCGGGAGGSMTFAYNTFNISLEKGLFFYAHGGGKFSCSGTSFKFYNNTIYQPRAANRWEGIGSGSGSLGISCGGNCTAKNNIIVAPTSPLGPGGAVSNNLINPNVAAVFVDAANGNFNLKAGSPAINAGVCDIARQPYGNKDFAGANVPTGGMVDIGAFEFGSGVASGC